MRRGFTLVELVVVVAIILILAAILLPIVANRIEDARISRLASEYRTIKTAVTMYYADTGLLPRNLNDLYIDPGITGWRGPYLDKRPSTTGYLISPFNTNMWIETATASWDGVNYDPLTILYVSRYAGTNLVITDNIYTRLDQRIDDGVDTTGILQVDDNNLKFFLIGIMP